MANQDMTAPQQIKTVLITGGARRIGAAICEHLHQRGFAVIVHYNQSRDDAQALTEKLNRQRPNSAVCLDADLTCAPAIDDLARRAVAWQGRLDVLVNNASTFYPTPVAEVTDELWRNLMSTNLKAPFFLCRALYPELKKRRGSIVNMLDIFSERPMAGHSVYSMAKAGNRMMVKALAQEFAPEVRVNAIAPGAILWPENQVGELVETPEKLQAVPMKRLGGTEPIVKAMQYLIEDATYTTGQVINVDGGRLLV